MTAEQTAEALREDARRHEQEAADSFDRCDTDGFVTQWAHGINAEVARLQADIVEQGGTWTFQGLFDSETGDRVKARIVRVAGYYGTTVSKWVVLDEDDNATHWVPAYKSGKQSKLYKLGLEERDEVAPAKADTGGSGRGLSGNVWVYARRLDRGYPEGARTLAEIRRG